VWRSVYYSYIYLKSLPPKTRHDKFMDTGREYVFIEYSDTTTSQYKVYAPDLGYVTRISVVKFNKYQKGGLINLRLR
jgi:hypothetical protein